MKEKESKKFGIPACIYFKESEIGYHEVRLESMRELVKIAARLGKPILRDTNNAYAEPFVVIDGDVVYKFTPE